MNINTFFETQTAHFVDTLGIEISIDDTAVQAIESSYYLEDFKVRKFEISSTSFQDGFNFLNHRVVYKNETLKITNVENKDGFVILTCPINHHLGGSL